MARGVLTVSIHFHSQLLNLFVDSGVDKTPKMLLQFSDVDDVGNVEMGADCRKKVCREISKGSEGTGRVHGDC